MSQHLLWNDLLRFHSLHFVTLNLWSHEIFNVKPFLHILPTAIVVTIDL